MNPGRPGCRYAVRRLPQLWLAAAHAAGPDTAPSSTTIIIHPSTGHRASTPSTLGIHHSHIAATVPLSHPSQSPHSTHSTPPRAPCAMPPAPPPQREASTSGHPSIQHQHPHAQSTAAAAAAASSSVSKLQSCRACQQRKRKVSSSPGHLPPFFADPSQCDRKQPQCSMCEKRGIECVFGLKLSQRNPQ